MDHMVVAVDYLVDVPDIIMVDVLVVVILLDLDMSV